MGRQMAEIRNGHGFRTNLARKLADFLMRTLQKLVQNPEFVHDFEGRGVNGVSAKITQEVGVFFEHHNIHAGPGKKESQHDAGRTTSGDATTGLDRVIHADHLDCAVSLRCLLKVKVTCATANLLNIWKSALLLLLSLSATVAQVSSPKREGGKTSTRSSPTWRFAVSGDSRNCGDVVMPGIAAGVIRNHADFYWHLGDLRWISYIDEDFKQLRGEKWALPNIFNYERDAWDDFIQNQVVPFGALPFYIGIGNHETTIPKKRQDFVRKFNQWLDAPVIKEQRLEDDPADSQVRTYYHWVHNGVDFINLDNATNDQFDEAQVKWIEGVLARDGANPAMLTVVVGMHEALPDSIASYHSMSHWSRGEQSGRQVYQDLLKLQNEAHKKVYILASHSHFFMDGIFNTEYWRTHGGVLPGWIIGTAGAVRYRLPANAKDADAAMTDVYGYLLATVNPRGTAEGTIHFEFEQLPESGMPEWVMKRFTPAFVHECFEHNRQ
jgi:hypothetical protein